jgi:hypothetical protein
MGILLLGVLAGFTVGLYAGKIILGLPSVDDKFLGIMPIILFSIMGGFIGRLIAKIIGWFPDKMYKFAREIKLIPFGNAGDDKKFFLDISDKNVTFYIDKKIWGSERQVIPCDKKVIICEDKGPAGLFLWERKFVKPIYHLIAFVAGKNKFQYTFLVPQGSVWRFTFKEGKG